MNAFRAAFLSICFIMLILFARWSWESGSSYAARQRVVDSPKSSFSDDDSLPVKGGQL